MKTNDEADDSCANCGKGECDNVKLWRCTACKLVRYCGVACQKDHRKQHKRACKQRVAELREEILFKQPESNYLGDCPICCLTLSIDMSKSTMNACSKVICDGCDYANYLREVEESLEHSCPFCRQPTPESGEDLEKKETKRTEANDPEAMRRMGKMRFMAGNYNAAFEYWSKAAGMGNVHAHHQLAGLYFHGQGVEKDMKKFVYHLEEAAVGGHPAARHRLGVNDWENGSYERAVKHWIIAATLGYGDSLKVLRELYAEGIVKKQDFEAALRAYQAAVDATKSEQRDAAEKAIKSGGFYSYCFADRY